VIAGDGTVQLPPEVLTALPPGTLLEVDYTDGRLSMSANDPTGGPTEDG
jgi:putative ABC transport system ATP-binding protein